MDGKTRDLIKSIDNWQAALLAPKNYNEQDPDNYIKTLEISFEQLCTALEELGINDPRRLTVFQFYSKVIYFEEKRRKAEEKKSRSK
jgi:molecular chaperone GrpE (heat shock protein)